MRAVQKLGRKAAEILGREHALIRTLRPAYESALAWLHLGRGIPWTINGVEYRIDPRYRKQLGNDYDAPVADFLANNVEQNAVCFDVGANVGVYVLQFAEWSKPGGRVVAFEPNPAAREVLSRHVEMNNISDRVTVVPDAVGDADGTATLHAAAADGMSRLGAPNLELSGKTEPITVHTTTLDAYCQANSVTPDWILIDIEGYEFSALAGAEQIIMSARRELGIVVEMHPSAWSDAGTDRPAADAMLENLGLKPVPLTGQHDALGEHGLVLLEYE